MKQKHYATIILLLSTTIPVAALQVAIDFVSEPLSKAFQVIALVYAFSAICWIRAIYIFVRFFTHKFSFRRLFDMLLMGCLGYLFCRIASRSLKILSAIPFMAWRRNLSVAHRFSSLIEDLVEHRKDIPYVITTLRKISRMVALYTKQKVKVVTAVPAKLTVPVNQLQPITIQLRDSNHKTIDSFK